MLSTSIKGENPPKKTNPTKNVSDLKLNSVVFYKKFFFYFWIIRMVRFMFITFCHNLSDSVREIPVNKGGGGGNVVLNYFKNESYSKQVQT